MRGFDVVFKKIDKIAEVMKEAAMIVATETAIDMEAYAKENRPWTDRNALARANLRGKAFIKDGVVHCQIRQDMYGKTGKGYGYYLENAHKQKYAILAPTQQHFEEQFFEDVRKECQEALKKSL